MSKNLSLLLDQYAEQVVQLQRQVAELQDALDEYESGAEVLAEDRGEELQMEDECDCEGCRNRRMFEGFMNNLGFQKGPEIQVEGDEPVGMDVVQTIDMLLKAAQEKAERKAAEGKVFDIQADIEKRLRKAGIEADIQVIRRSQ